MSRLQLPAALFIALLSVATASAQGNADADTGAAGGEIGTLDPDVAFSEVERGNAVGSTASSGTGFSELSAANGGAGGGGGLGGLGGFGGGGLGGLGALFGGLNSGNNQSTRPAIRTRLRSAVEVTRRSPTEIGRTAKKRFRDLSSRPELRGVGVRMEGRTAVLTGQVQTERHRRMSELLMQLEPGVRSIDNQLTVAGE